MKFDIEKVLNAEEVSLRDYLVLKAVMLQKWLYLLFLKAELRRLRATLWLLRNL